MRNVYKITFDFCAFGTKWRKRTTVLAGHMTRLTYGLSTACAVVGTNGAVLRVKTHATRWL